MYDDKSMLTYKALLIDKKKNKNAKDKKKILENKTHLIPNICYGLEILNAK